MATRVLGGSNFEVTDAGHLRCAHVVIRVAVIPLTALLRRNVASKHTNS